MAWQSCRGYQEKKSPEIEIPTTYKASKKSRERRRTVDEQDDLIELLKAADLLPLQQEVLFQQMAVFSAAVNRRTEGLLSIEMLGKSL